MFLIEYFGADECAVAAVAAQGASEKFFTFAEAVHLGGVIVVDARLEGAVEHPAGFVAGNAEFSGVLEAAQPQRRDFQTGAPETALFPFAHNVSPFGDETGGAIGQPRKVLYTSSVSRAICRRSTVS